VSLREKRRIAADIPVVFEREGTHPSLGRINGHLNHVLRAVNKVRECVNVRIDRPLKKFVLDSRIDVEHFRVVLEHLVEIVFRVELANTLHG
jgi:hypothetical protein